MELKITGTPNEIAALVVVIQERQNEDFPKEMPFKLDSKEIHQKLKENISTKETAPRIACLNCGAEFDITANFCGRCRTQLKENPIILYHNQ